MTRAAICATCEFFTLRDSPRASEGIGACHGYDGHVAPVEPFVRWDAPHCVLYGKAADMAQRLQWIEMRKRKEGGDVAAACVQPHSGDFGTSRLRSHAPINLNALEAAP